MIQRSNPCGGRFSAPVQAGQGVALTTHPYLALRLELHLYAPSGPSGPVIRWSLPFLPLPANFDSSSKFYACTYHIIINFFFKIHVYWEALSDYYPNTYKNMLITYLQCQSGQWQVATSQNMQQCRPPHSLYSCDSLSSSPISLTVAQSLAFPVCTLSSF